MWYLHIPWFAVFFSRADGGGDFLNSTSLITAASYLYPFIHAVVYGGIHSPTHSSIQVQTIMEHYHVVRLAERCQWPRSAQYPPLISPRFPLLKTLNTQSSLLGPCRPSVLQTSMEKQCWVAACMQDVQGDTDQYEGCGWVSKMSIDCQEAAQCRGGAKAA